MSALRWQCERDGLLYRVRSPLPAVLRGVEIRVVYFTDPTATPPERESWGLDMWGDAGTAFRWHPTPAEAMASATVWCEDPWAAFLAHGHWHADVPCIGGAELHGALWLIDGGWHSGEVCWRVPAPRWPTPRRAYLELARRCARAGAAVDWAGAYEEARELSEHPALAGFERASSPTSAAQDGGR